MTLFRLCCAIPYLIAVLACRPHEGWAWGSEGHRIIALVAEQLTGSADPAVQKRVAEILASDKSNNWTKTDIASEATWADALLEKSPEGRAASSKWHFVKLDPDSPDLKKACFGRPALPALRPASRGPQDDCIVDKLEQFAKELRDPSISGSERLMALQFLLNLVGDIHEPLNAIEHHDQGGRCLAVLAPGARSPERLSAYWDTTLVAIAAGKDLGKAAAQITAAFSGAEVQKWAAGGPEEWAQETHNVAKTVVYNFPGDAVRAPPAVSVRKGEKDTCGPVTVHRLDLAYQERAIVTVKEQLAKAGVRLSVLLQRSLR